LSNYVYIIITVAKVASQTNPSSGGAKAARCKIQFTKHQPDAGKDKRLVPIAPTPPHLEADSF